MHGRSCVAKGIAPTSVLFFISSYDFSSLPSFGRLIGIMRLSLISSSISNKHSSQNSLSSESHRSRTLLFLLHRAHLFILSRPGDLIMWVTWKMDADSLNWVTNRNQKLFCEQCKTRITSQGAGKIIVLIDQFPDIDRSRRSKRGAVM